nr:MAG: hypothetical protein CM15mV30_1060 [uncultured marine virus]
MNYLSLDDILNRNKFTIEDVVKEITDLKLPFNLETIS